MWLNSLRQKIWPPTAHLSEPTAIIYTALDGNTPKCAFVEFPKNLYILLMHLNRNPAWKKPSFPSMYSFVHSVVYFSTLTPATRHRCIHSIIFWINALFETQWPNFETDCITALSPRCLHSLPDHYQYRDRRWATDRRIKKVRRGKQNHKENTSKPFREADKNNKDAWNRNAIIKAHLPERGKSFLEPVICSLVYYTINTIIFDVFMITTVILN